MKVNSHKLNDAAYPVCLRQLHKTPSTIYISGAPLANHLARPRIAIVGSRKISAYGRLITDQLASELTRAGLVIVSGLAYGVDATAHRACVAAGGQTIAVLPGPLDYIYPPAHRNLAKQIIDSGGTLISEYPSGTPTLRHNFIERNRLVSALADAILITEAARNSGSMHTAGFALEQGKQVLAVPGNINSPTSEGCNNLIKAGAIPVTSTEDVLLALKIEPSKSQSQRVFKGEPNQQKVYELIGRGVFDQESLAAAANLDSATLNSALTMLEINGYIRAEAGSWQII